MLKLYAGNHQSLKKDMPEIYILLSFIVPKTPQVKAKNIQNNIAT